MYNKVFINNNGLLEIWVVGDQTADSVREMGEKLVYYAADLRDRDRPVLVLDNLLPMGATTSEARREVARVAKALDFDRGAMVGGGNLAFRYGTNLMLRAIGRRNLRYFAHRESAQKWLLEAAATPPSQQIIR